MHNLSNYETEQWIKDYVDGETAVPRKKVQDAETSIMQKQEDMRYDEPEGLTFR